MVAKVCLWSGSYTLAPNRRFSTRGGHVRANPALDALIGILYKDVHDFAVWFHEDHDELMADMQEHNSGNDSESDVDEPNSGNESSVQASVSDKETKPTDESDQGAGDGNGSNEAEVKINENEEEDKRHGA